MNRRSTNGPTYAFSDRLNLGHSHIHSSSMDSSRMVRSTFSQLLRLSVLAACIISCTTAPVSTDTQAMIYLSQFGYLNPSARNPASGHIIDETSWTNAILEFQNFAGINETGELDDETTRWMSLPRCGVKDKVGFDTDSRSKRYALQGSRWRVKDLLYRISKYPRNLPRAEVDLEVAKSFEVWTKYTDLTFTPKKTGQVHIEIRFEKGEHGDGDPFDGPGGTLAHAYFPVYGGDAHFDDAETWTTNSYTGTNLFQVAAHEIGHALGLSHSDTKSALMAPFYRGYDPSFSLNSDDVQGIQALYGKKTTPDVPGSGSGGSGGSGPPAPPQPGRADERLCADSKFDTIFNSDQGATYAFKGDYYWKLADDGIAPNYPRPISKSWIGLPGNIDAAFTYKNGKTYFFKGTKYWRYQGKRMDGEYPKDISDGFTGIPDNVDASLVWSGNGKIYFFKGSKFWRFDPSQRPPVKATYPKPISNWEGVPNNLDAAFQYTNGYSYFFKDGTYYRFNDRTFSVDAADPAFPRSTAYWWFGCKSSPSGTVGGKAKLDLPAEEQDGEPSDGSDLVLDAVGSDERGPERPDNGSSSSKPANATIFFTLLVVYLTIRKMAAI